MMYNMKYMETEQKYIENWKLCDYTYCPQIINQLIDHHVSIQTERGLLRHQLAELYDIKMVVQIMEYIDANRAWIEALDREALDIDDEETEKLCSIFITCAEYENKFWDYLADYSV